MISAMCYNFIIAEKFSKKRLARKHDAPTALAPEGLSTQIVNSGRHEARTRVNETIAVTCSCSPQRSLVS